MRPKLQMRDIKFLDFPTDQFKKVKTKKTQVVLHTTAGNSADSAIGWWLITPEDVATHFIVDRDGQIYQCYNTDYWAYHIGPIKDSVFKNAGIPKRPESYKLNEISVGIEIVSWGPLYYDKDEFFSYTGKKVPKDEVYCHNDPHGEYPWCPFFNKLGINRDKCCYYHEITPQQIESVRRILVLLNEKKGIDITYNDDIWEVNSRALQGLPGLYTHNSYRPDKSDADPQKALIEMLKNPF